MGGSFVIHMHETCRCIRVLYREIFPRVYSESTSTMTDAGTERFRVIFLLITAVSSGVAATSLCFDGNSSFQKQGCLCQAEDMYTAQILCPFLEGELPPPMSQNYSNVNTL